MVLGENAHVLKGEMIFDTYAKSFSKYTIDEGGRKIPIPVGLFSAIKKVRPDVLITEGFFQWTPLVLLYAFFHRLPVYIGYERTAHTERNVSRLLKWHRKITDKFVTGYLVNGTETKKYLLSLGIKQDKIHIGGMNADGSGLCQRIASLETSEINDLKKQFKRGNNGIIYLFSGRVTELKGIKYLLKAWVEHIKIHPNDSLIVVGGGDLLNECVSLYADCQSIYFEGRVDYMQIHKYYGIADVFILPTLVDNWSLVIPEAMSCGLPVATSIYNGCYVDLIKEGVNGFVFDTFKQETIIDVLDKFHYVDLKEFGRKSIELEKEFDTDHCAQRTYNAIVGNGN